ncbi:uncharacterized protein LOC110112820, partial [Dendrobium catenatum]|uniref:uncharacterized protein LOC110112820 n=1 Tax=Dendrobium catenatum TaxID=906689 RepID=UPI0009F66DE4
LVVLDSGKEVGRVVEGKNLRLNVEKKSDNWNEVGNAWTKPRHINIDWNSETTELSDDGVAVLLNSEKEEKNKHVLRNSVVIKVLGNNVPFPMCSLELRKQWSRYVAFHLTSIGMDWILCSFKTEEVVEEVINGGPWFVGGHIVGMDRWTTEFDPYSFKWITAPIWIHLLCLALYCWDDDNIAIIASQIGTPKYFDGNTFRWGKREFARICVKMDLENKLPNGVWVEGAAGRFFQRVEYEKVDLLCYKCGRVGHNQNGSPVEVAQGISDQTTVDNQEVAEANSGLIKKEY